jgi:hypothetical protein
MGDNDEVVRLRLETRITGKHMHVILTDKSLLYGPNKGKRSQFISHKLPNKEGNASKLYVHIFSFILVLICLQDVIIDQKGPYPVLQIQLPAPTPKLEITVQTIVEATSFTNTLPPKKGKPSSSGKSVDDLADLMAKVSTKSDKNYMSSISTFLLFR